MIFVHSNEFHSDLYFIGIIVFNLTVASKFFQN